MTRDMRIIIAYALTVTFLYIFFPLGFAFNWYHLFDPMRSGFIPYVDFQAGYPVLGFIPYGLLALLCPSERIYGYVMRYINLALLSISLFVIYKVVYRHRGQRDALLTILAPMLSVSVLIGNLYSNDVMALCFFSLALFFLMRKSPTLCGLLMGLAIFAKIYPLLLLPMFLAFFENWRERLSLLTSLVLSVLLLNFLFIVLNPYMWCETFFGGNAGRGPWETIWAFLSGYYSHGGVGHIHPYFEGFFTYVQLKQIYPLTHADHAFYLYSNSTIPLIMSSLSLLSFIVPLILFTRERILELIGLSSSLFFLASKGYSPQFSIFTIPLLALSVSDKKKFVLTSLLDAATILQMMNWSGWFAPLGEGFFLPYAVFLRTAVLVSAFIICFNYTTSGLRMRKVIVTRVRSFLSDLARSLHAFFASRQIVKSAVPLVALILVFGLLFYTTYGSYAGKLVGYDRKLEVNTYEMNMITITHDLKERIYIIIPKLLDVVVNASDCYIEEAKINNTTRVFLTPHHEGVTNIYIKLLYPVTNFYIDEVLINGDVKKVKGFVKLHQENFSLTITAKNPDEQRYYVLYLSWSVSFRISESTTIYATLTHLDGNLNNTVLDLVDEKGVFFDYELIPGYSRSGMVWEKVINASCMDAFGRYFTDFFGKNVSDMSLVMTLKPSTSATVKLDVLSYSTNGRKTQLPITVQDSIICNAKVYLGEFFNLKNPPVGIITWSIPVIAALYAHYLVRRVKVEGINNK